MNVSFGCVPDRSLAAASALATRGGDESTVGITSPGALRCESVMLPSELGHMMTIGVFAIWVPNPLRKSRSVTYEVVRTRGRSQSHPAKGALPITLHGICIAVDEALPVCTILEAYIAQWSR